jgi:hypothetical protein
MAKEMEVGRQISVTGMAYAPTSEQGVVFLFGILAPRLGFCIEHVQTHFPDCTARHRGKTCRIEFEYWASSYVGHPHRGADMIVCWENDWETVPPKYKHLEIISLKKYVGALPRIFAVGCDEKVRGKSLDRWSHLDWSVPLAAQVGDLIVMYRKDYPSSEIRDLWRVVGPFYDDEKRWGRQAYLRCVVRLNNPLTYAELASDRVTRDLGVVRKRFIGKTDITDYWPLIRQKILRLNPKAKADLSKYRFDE